jgi:hypothetical protein
MYKAYVLKICNSVSEKRTFNCEYFIWNSNNFLRNEIKFRTYLFYVKIVK